MGPTTVLRMSVDVGDDDVGELDRLTRGLAAQLRGTDADRVEVVAPTDDGTGGPAGAKSAGVAAAAGVVVELVRSASRLRAVLVAVADWVSRHATRTVKIRIGEDYLELTGADVTEQHALVEAFVARHGAVAAG